MALRAAGRPDRAAVISSLATVAIASLGGPVAGAGAALTEAVKHSEAMHRGNKQANLLRQQVAGAITSWAAGESVGEVDQGLDLAVRIIGAHGVNARESAELRYDAEEAAERVVARAGKDQERFGELTKYAAADEVMVAKKAVQETYAALYEQLGMDERLLPALVVLLEESRGDRARMDAKLDWLISTRFVGVNGRVVVGQIPGRSAAFVARGELGDLEGTLAQSRVGVVCALSGMRGVGKTQVAAAYARAKVDEGWSLVGWVDAETPDSLVAGLARVAEALGVADPDGDSIRSAENLRGHLQTREEPGLLVLDNAVDPDLVRRYLPNVGSTQVVVTTTESAFSHLGRLVEVAQFTREQSLAYLQERTGQDDPDGAVEVAEVLGHLPLALASASAIVAGPPTVTYGAFLAELKAFPVEEVLGRQAGHEYPRSVAAALLLSVQRVEVDDPTELTSTLLRVIAALSSDGVELEILNGLTPDAEVHPTRSLRAALTRCTTGSLLTWPTGADTTVMHRLLARVIRDRATITQQTTDTVTTCLALLEPHLFDHTAAWSRRDDGRRLIGHIEALWDSAPPDGITEALEAGLLRAREWSVRHLLNTDLNRATKLGASVLADRVRVLGSDHPDTLSSRNDLARAYQAVGRLEEAIGLYEATLADRMWVLGNDHPATLTSQANLAGAYQTVGRLEEAIGLYEATLANRVRVLGGDHPATLNSRSNLAHAYEAVGRLEEAISLYEATLADRVRVLGNDHPATLTSQANLAGAYQAVGRLEEAIGLFEATLADQGRVLGVDHPDTLLTRHNLVGAYRSVGRVEQAIGLYEMTLADQGRVLGGDHPHTLTLRANLAGAYQEVGRVQEAIALFEATLADRVRVLGSDHPDTLTTRHLLAYAYQEVGQVEEAIALFEATLDDRVRVLGSDHPDTLASRHNLARGYQVVGRLQEAINLYETTLADEVRVLGSDRQETLATQNNLALTYQEAGRVEEAIRLFEATLADYQRVLGPQHPHTLTARNNLALTYQAVGRLEEAINLFQATLADCVRALGNDHPNVLLLRNNLAHAYGAAGRLEEAINLFEATLADRMRVLGGDHPDTLLLRNNLAYSYEELGRTQEAIALFEATLADQVRVLGRDHPATLTTRTNLVHAYRSVGRLEEAIALQDSDNCPRGSE